MAVFKINLARSRVIPAARRKTWYQMLVLYLSASGLLLALLASSVTRNIISAHERRSQLLRREQQALPSPGGRGDMAAYVAKAGADMIRHADKLEAITGILSNESRIAVIIVALTSPLSNDMILNNMDANADKGEISFEVWAPEDGTASGTRPTSLVAAWSRDPALMAEVTQLASLGSHSSQINGRKFSVWRFAGRLAHHRAGLGQVVKYLRLGTLRRNGA